MITTGLAIEFIFVAFIVTKVFLIFICFVLKIF